MVEPNRPTRAVGEDAGGGEIEDRALGSCLPAHGATEHSTDAIERLRGCIVSGYRVAMDIGGTFTDFVVVDGAENGETSSGKVLTTPANPADGVLEGLRQFVPEPSAIDFLVHGTTVGLNAFLERKGTRLLLVMTEGLRDAYSIARHDRKELYALRYHKPERLVPRRDVVEVVERLRWDGSVETPLDPASLEPALRAHPRGAESRLSRSA